MRNVVELTIFKMHVLDAIGWKVLSREIDVFNNVNNVYVFHFKDIELNKNVRHLFKRLTFSINGLNIKLLQMRSFQRLDKNRLSFYHQMHCQLFLLEPNI